MEITCPDCGFSRNVPEDRLPDATVVANCPMCGCRFRFSSKEGPLAVLKRGDRADAAGGGDDPLPSCATVIHHDEAVTADDASSDQGQRADVGAERRDAYPPAGSRDTDGSIPPRIPADPVDREKATGCRANPWDKAPGCIGWTASFYQTVMRVMFAAPRFFASLAPDAELKRPLIFYVILCAAQAVIEAFWGRALVSVLQPAVTNDPQLETLLAMLTPPMNIAMSLLIQTSLHVLQIFFFAFIIALVCRFIAPERAQFSLVFQVFAYSAAPSLLCVVPVLGSIVGSLWCLGCLVVGLRQALSINWAQTAACLAPIFLLMAFFVREIFSLLH
ncbi:MAG: zinc-ribbon domain-containing protein [Desulfovibrio sp.]|nr:zinc-ribbon domain-containing protein [Desulfovibrio sp.]